jgi:hypothetical protein
MLSRTSLRNIRMNNDRLKTFVFAIVDVAVSPYLLHFAMVS